MSQYRPWEPGIECKQGASVSGTVPLRFSWSQVGERPVSFPIQPPRTTIVFAHREALRQTL